MSWLYTAVLIARLSARVAVLEARYTPVYYWVQEGPDKPGSLLRNGNYRHEVTRCP